MGCKERSEEPAPFLERIERTKKGDFFVENERAVGAPAEGSELAVRRQKLERLKAEGRDPFVITKF